MHLPSILAEYRMIPDSLIRVGIRNQIKAHSLFLSKNPKSTDEWIKELFELPIAQATEISKEQHYEVPTEYFKYVLGPNLKYSACYWKNDASTLSEAEEEMLSITARHAKIENGQEILELGCGWGSFSLWLAKKYPNSNITAMSHSKSQKEYIDSQIKKYDIRNLKIITNDINNFHSNKKFDRIVSIEMFEHIRNHQKIFKRLESWLKPSGLLFIHVFTHKDSCYLFEPNYERDWMAKYFFTGGIMPSTSLIPNAALGFKLEKKWAINGNHYSKTLDSWLNFHDKNESKIIEIFEKCYGKKSKLWSQRWRIFYLACSELFSFNEGNDWFVMHYLFKKA